MARREEISMMLGAAASGPTSAGVSNRLGTSVAGMRGAVSGSMSAKNLATEILATETVVMIGFLSAVMTVVTEIVAGNELKSVGPIVATEIAAGCELTNATTTVAAETVVTVGFTSAAPTAATEIVVGYELRSATTMVATAIVVGNEFTSVVPMVVTEIVVGCESRSAATTTIAMESVAASALALEITNMMWGADGGDDGAPRDAPCRRRPLPL
jgi:hypothetical protein